MYNQKSNAGSAFMRIASRLCGENIPIVSKEKSNSIFTKLGKCLGF